MAMLSIISAGCIFLLATFLAPCSQAHPIPAISAECSNISVDTHALKNEIRQRCRNIESSCENIHNTLLGFDKEHATVGLHPIPLNKTKPGHALAKSVSLFHTFLRPLGDALTNETVREVADQVEGVVYGNITVREELYYIYGNITVATKIDQLIKSDPNIHECVIPFLPANTNPTLAPKGIPGVGDERKIILDGLAGEMKLLAADVIELLS